MTTVAVRERPILFSGEMVRAILDGRKTQTRRVLVPIPQRMPSGALLFYRGDRQFQWFEGASMPDIASACPFGGVGDRLWVRECFTLCDARDEEDEDYVPVLYRADPVFDGMQASDFAWRWSPSIHMPRWASRLTLEITSIRVERVQSITYEDCEAEGVLEAFAEERDEAMSVAPPGQSSFPAPRKYYERLWDSLNAKRGYGWDLNPWVWVVEFRKVAS